RRELVCGDCGVEERDRTVRPHAAERVAAVRAWAAGVEAAEEEDLRLLVGARAIRGRIVQRVLVVEREQEADRASQRESDVATDGYVEAGFWPLADVVRRSAEPRVLDVVEEVGPLVRMDWVVAQIEVHREIDVREADRRERRIVRPEVGEGRVDLEVVRGA